MSRHQLPLPGEQETGIIIKVFLVNGESRSLRIYNWYTVTNILQDILPRLHVNMDVALDLFGIQFRNPHSKESYWLQPGYPVLQLVHEYSADTSVTEWQFLLQIRILPKTPQHIGEVDIISFQYFYDQVLNKYLSGDSVPVDNEVAVKLGCLELRRFFKDMPHAALKKKENFTMLEKEIGLEKFFKKSLLDSVKKKQLRTMVLAAFKEYEHVTSDVCMFKFFNLLAKYHRIDEDMFTSCAVGNNQSLPLNCAIHIGPNCNIEYRIESKERRFLAAFSEIQGISYESELISRGKIILDLRNNPAVTIRTALLVTAIDMSSLIDSYCTVYTDSPHSRLTGVKRFSTSQMSEGLYNTIDELRLQLQPVAGTGDGGGGGNPIPYSITALDASGSSEFSTSHDFTEIDPYEVVGMREYHTIPPQDLLLGEKIGEGQFGDVHNGYLYPKTMDEIDVAIKTCKPDASHEDKVKFLEEAAVMCKFRHPNIIKLYGVVSHMDLAYIVMELAPHGQLRRYLLLEGSRITRLMLLGYIAQMASAMVHLEDMNYVHRDIAARNILVCTPQVIKLADFGLSRGLEDGDYYVASRGKLPIKWMAPESINFRRFTGLSDVWMFGVCCWEVLMRGVKPFVGIKNDEVISKIESGERLALPVECPATLYMLMNMCWRYDPLERPRFVEIEARLNEIIEEELPVDQMSGRRFVGGGQIQRDPEAPAKPHRHTRTPPMVRVPSDSPGGLGARGSLAVPYPSEGGQQVVRVTEKVEWQREDLPPLPPRPMERFRDLSTSPPGQRGGGRGPSPILGNVRNSSHPPQSHDYHLNRESRQPNHALPPPPHIVPPYSVTTLSPASDDQERHTMQIRPDSPSSAGRQSHMAQSDSPLGGYHANSHIPPPAILSQHPNHQPRGGGEGGGIYYSTPAEIVEKKQQQRVLTKEGVFMSRDVGSPLGSMDSINNDSREQGVRPKLGEDRPISHASTGESSGMSSPALPDDKNYPTPSNYESHYETQYEESFTLPDEDEILKLTMGVVKTVKELSDRVHKSKPNDYVDLVKNVGLALRDLLGKVDGSLNKLPPETHTEVTMAQKVLSSDMNQLVSAMKDAQAHYDKFLEQEYQKKMLKAAHVVAVNSKLLLDAINSAKRKAHLMR